jgi:hypothetical protein
LARESAGPTNAGQKPGHFGEAALTPVASGRQS